MQRYGFRQFDQAAFVQLLRIGLLWRQNRRLNRDVRPQDIWGKNPTSQPQGRFLGRFRYRLAIAMQSSHSQSRFVDCTSLDRSCWSVCVILPHLARFSPFQLILLVHRFPMWERKAVLAGCRNAWQSESDLHVAIRTPCTCIARWVKRSRKVPSDELSLALLVSPGGSKCKVAHQRRRGGSLPVLGWGGSISALWGKTRLTRDPAWRWRHDFQGWTALENHLHMVRIPAPQTKGPHCQHRPRLRSCPKQP